MIGRYQLYALVLGAGVMNAVTKPVLQHLHQNGMSSLAQGFGISFVIWTCLFWGLYQLAVAPYRPVARTDLITTGLVLVLLLIPLATVSWVITGCCAIFLIGKAKRHSGAKAGLSVLAFAALRDPLASLALKLLADPLLAADTYLVSSFFNLFLGSGEQTGNLFVGDNGHQLLILTGCTSYTNMSIALLGWFTLSHATKSAGSAINWWVGALVAFAILTINVIRLSAMALGPDAYVFMHDGPGVALAEAAMLLSTFVITYLGSRNHDFRKTDTCRV